MPSRPTISTISRIGTAGDEPKSIGFVGLTTGETHPLMYRPSVEVERISSGGVVTSTPMPTLEELLRRNQVAYTLLESSPTEHDGLSTRPLIVVWSLLCVWAMIWGVLTGMAIARDGFFVHPTIGISALLFELPLIATAATWAAAKRLVREPLTRG